MRLMRTLLATACALSLAGGAFAVELRPTEKIVTTKPAANGALGTQGLLDCSGAVEVDLNVGVYTGTNAGAPNNVSFYDCSLWDESGGEVVYHVTFPADVTWEVGLSGMTDDLDLAVLDSCDESLGCLIVVNSGVYVSEPFPGEFWFVVDGYAGATSDFTLTFTTAPYTPPPPAPTMCELIQDVTGTYFTGDTCDGYNNISVEACGDYTEAGLEHYYEIQVPAGCFFSASVTYPTEDGALWLLDTCAPGYACLGYADDTVTGGAEVVSWTNTTGTAQSVILVIDSYGTAACGPYEFTFTSECAVATEVETFGGVKALFR